MIRGVNKQIIEVNDIDNSPFYKAILFVRPESNMSNEKLNDFATEYIADTSSDIKGERKAFLRNRDKRMKRIGLFIVFGTVIVSVAIVLFAIFTRI